MESFSKYILRDESRWTTNAQLTEKIVALLIDRHADVTRIPRQLHANLLDELKIVSESKVCLDALFGDNFENFLKILTVLIGRVSVVYECQ